MQKVLDAITESNHPFIALFRRHAGFSKFLVVGSLNTLLDITLFFCFSNLLGIHPIIANILSTGITLCMSFFLNHKFVFRSQRKKSRTAVQFVVITLFNAWVVQSLIIGGIVHVFGGADFFATHAWTLNLVAKLCSVAVSFILNFLGYRYIFKEKHDTAHD